MSAVVLNVNACVLLIAECSRASKKRGHVGRWVVIAALFMCVASMRAQNTADTQTAPAQSAASSAQELQQLRQLVLELQARVNRLESAKKERQVSATTVAAATDRAVEQAQPSTPSQAAPADKPAPGPFDGFVDVLGGATFSGFVDTYYGVNFSQPVVPASSLTSLGGHVSVLRTWDGFNNGLTLNMLQLAVDKVPDAKSSRVGYHVALAFGSAMNTLNNAEPQGLRHNFSGSGWDQYLMEAYFSYLAPVGKGLQVDVGKFVTPHGAEVVPTKDNWNYTRGLLYDFAIPFYHFGMRAKYIFNDKVTLTGFLVNGWNNVIDNNSGKTLGASLAWSITKKLTWTQNYMAGPEQDDTSVAVVPALGFTPLVTPTADQNWRQLSDTTLAYAVTPRLTLQTNFDYGRGDRVPGINRPVWWSGVANYVRYVFNPRNAFTVRHEYYDDHDGFTTGTAQHLHEVTATYERRFAGHMISRLEYRHDMSNRPVFFDHSVGLLNGGNPTLMDQNVFTAGLIYVLQKSE
jgi:hypothetical protein